MPEISAHLYDYKPITLKPVLEHDFEIDLRISVRLTRPLASEPETEVFGKRCFLKNSVSYPPMSIQMVRAPMIHPPEDKTAGDTDRRRARPV